MATIINGPMGISESQLMSKSAPTMTSAMHHKRAELRAMLIQKLCQAHGADAPEPRTARARRGRVVANMSASRRGSELAYQASNEHLATDLCFISLFIRLGRPVRCL